MDPLLLERKSLPPMEIRQFPEGVGSNMFFLAGHARKTCCVQTGGGVDKHFLGVMSIKSKPGIWRCHTPITLHYSVAQSRPFDLLVFPFWVPIFSRGTKR